MTIPVVADQPSERKEIDATVVIKAAKARYLGRRHEGNVEVFYVGKCPKRMMSHLNAGTSLVHGSCAVRR